MMRLRVIACAALVVLGRSSFSEVPTGIQWQQSFGGGSNEYVRVVKQTTDGGYIVGGESDSDISGNKTSAANGFFDYWIVKVDAENNKQWEKSFGGDGFEQLSSLQQTTDGGYILGGFSNSGISGNKTNAGFGGYDFWVIKVDSDGTKQWEKSFGGSGGDFLFSLQQTTDGGYILGGQSASGVSGNKTNINFGNFDYWVVKVDGAGTKEWERVYGGSSEDYFTSVEQTTDNGYILGGGSRSGVSGNKTESGFGNFDFWVIKIDGAGDKQWERSFGSTNTDDFSSLQQTADNGYVLGGYSTFGSSGNKTNGGFGLVDYWVVKVDPNGNKQWDQSYGGTNNDSLFSLQQTTDGGYIFGGSSTSQNSGNKSATNFGFQDYWVVKTDANGNSLWDKAFGGTNSDFLLSLQQTPDGGYILGGRSQSEVSGNKTTFSFGEFDYWVLKFGAPLYFQSFSRDVNHVQAELVGAAGTDYIFQTSTNLVDWISLLTNNSPNGLINFVDTNGANFPKRFYRAKEHP